MTNNDTLIKLIQQLSTNAISDDEDINNTVLQLFQSPFEEIDLHEVVLIIKWYMNNPYAWRGDIEFIVLWINAVGCGITSGNALIDTVVSSWSGNSGASSLQSINSSGGYVSIMVTETNTYRNFGLSHYDADQTYTSIDYAFGLGGDGNLYILESGTQIGGVQAKLVKDDVLKVAVENGTVNYYRNGTLLYTSSKTPTFPLIVDTAFMTSGATLGNPVIATRNTPITTNFNWNQNGHYAQKTEVMTCIMLI